MFLCTRPNRHRFILFMMATKVWVFVNRAIVSRSLYFLTSTKVRGDRRMTLFMARLKRLKVFRSYTNL